MTIKQELIKYAEGCISNKIPSCIKHKWACERFLNDLERKDWGYYWDEEQAQKIVKWFSMLKHSKGALAGQFINLTTSQKFFLCQIYGWRCKSTGRKRFVQSFKEVARKNAKSQEEAGCALYELAVEATANGEIYEGYCAGTKRDQSKIIFDECKNLLKGSPLRAKFKITNSAIVHIKTGSFLKPLSKEDGRSGDGTNPAILILDEYHQHPTTEFYDLGLGSNTKQSLLMIITTAGKDLNCPCYQQEYKYCTNILNPDVDVWNDRYYVDIFEIDKGDDINDRSNWMKANPVRMSYPEGVEKIEQAYKIASVQPEKMTAFRTKMLDEWVQQRDRGYMDMSKWKKCEVEQLPIDITGAPVYVGFDMSAKIDLTSVAFVIPFLTNEGEVGYIVFSHSFIPNRERLAERISVDHAPYDAWERNGYLTVTETEIVDQEAVWKYVKKFVKKYNLSIETLCFDPANASKMMMDLSNEGYDVEEVYQSYRSLNESAAGFREQVYCGNVYYLCNPVLNFAMANAVVKTNDGYIKIDKDATRQRIDPVDALLCAFKLAFYHDFTIVSSDQWLEEE